MQKFSKWLLNEAISGTAVDSVNKIAKSYLTKKLGTKVYSYPRAEEFLNSTGRGYGIRYFYKDKSIRFNWKGANISSFTLDSVDLWDGTSHDPNWHMDFDSQQSLVKTLPLIVDFILSPFGTGTFWLVPSDDKSPIKESLIIESSGSKDVFDHILTFMKTDEKIAISSLGNAEFDQGKCYKLMRSIIDLYPHLFRKEGKANVFAGTKDDLNHIKDQKEGILKGVGGIKVKVSVGGKKESYLPSDQENEIESKGIEKVAYEEQLKHLSVLMKMVVKGATNALFVAGRGGCLDPKTEINIHQKV